MSKTYQENKTALFGRAIAIAKDLRTMGQEAMLTIDNYAHLDNEKLAYLQGFMVAKLDNPIDYSRGHISKTQTLTNTPAGEPIKATLYFTVTNQSDFGFWMYGVNVCVPTKHWVLCSQCRGLYDDIEFYDHDRKVEGDFFRYITK